MNKPIDWSKPVQTVDGKPLRVLCTDRPQHHHPVIALDPAGALRTYTIDGTLSGDGYRCPHVINAPVKKYGWVNVYDDDGKPWAANAIYESEDLANGAAAKYRVACKKIEWEQ